MKSKWTKYSEGVRHA